MPKEDLVVAEGVVTEVLPNTVFKVKINNTEHIMLCYLNGRLKKHNIKIILGDRVRVETTPIDPARGRIIYRL